MELDIVIKSLCYLCTLALVTYIRDTVMTSPKMNETAAHCCDPGLSVLVMSDVSKRLSRSISLTVYLFVFTVM